MPTATVSFLEKIIGEALKKLKSNVRIRGRFLINIQFTDDNDVDAEVNFHTSKSFCDRRTLK